VINYQQRPRAAVIEIFDSMARRGLALDDLIQIGGEDLRPPNPKRVEKARHVEKVWALMARLSVKFAELEQAPGQSPAKPAGRRRGGEPFLEVIGNKEISGGTPRQVKSLKINNKTDHHSVEASEKGRWKHKRRLVTP
jgi:hypothetical protein